MMRNKFNILDNLYREERRQILYAALPKSIILNTTQHKEAKNMVEQLKMTQEINNTQHIVKYNWYLIPHGSLPESIVLNKQHVVEVHLPLYSNVQLLEIRNTLQYSAEGHYWQSR